MSERTHIEWCDATFNAWRGCTKVSPGCAHCYAETLSRRNPAVLGQWGPGAPRVQASESYWRQPLKWNAKAAAFPWKCPACKCAITDGVYESDPSRLCSNCGKAALVLNRPRVFCASLSDWLDDEVPIEWLARLLALIHATPHLDWLLLTKRPQNFSARIAVASDCQKPIWAGNLPQGERALPSLAAHWEEWKNGRPPANVWIGTTVEDQVRADERIPILLSIPAKVRFLSCEPLLGPVNLCPFRIGITPPDTSTKIHWVIAGGESGPGARPMHPEWARGLRDQCAVAGVPFLFKQWGEWQPGTLGVCESDHHFLDGHIMHRVGKKLAGRQLDGSEHNGFPV